MPRYILSGRRARLVLLAAIGGLLSGCLIHSADGPAGGRTDAPVPASQPAPAPGSAQMDPVLARIREEGLNRSKAPETIDYLCNVIGPRLTASPNLHEAAGWTRDTLSSWGLADAHLEPWGPFGRGWSLRRFTMEVTEPKPFLLTGYPKAWSPGFDQPLEAEMVYVDARTEAALAPFKGKLAGKIVLLGQVREPDLPLAAPATRMSDEQLTKLAASRPSDTAATTLAASTAPSGELLVPHTGPDTGPATGRSSAATQLAAARLASRMFAFVAAESPALVLTPTTKGDGGIHFVTGVALPTDPASGGAAPATVPSTRPTPWGENAPKTPPQIVLAIEDFNRLARMAKRGIPIKLRVDLQVQFHDADPMVPNVIAEIPGTDLADEVVMVGAHLDSWHAGTGATDNAFGSTAAMEAVRILKALDLKPRRTIRVALWTGEEQGLLGSTAYVKRHFGRMDEPATTRPAGEASSRRSRRSGPATRPSTATAPADGPPARSPAVLVKAPDYEKLSAYFNLDNGGGRVRGIYCQGNEAAMPVFAEWLAPFNDLGAGTVTLSNTGATDHIAFDRIGLPGFQFIQDPLDYRTRTHHSSQDNFDRVQMQDLKQASTIMAWFVWKAANEPERFPRKPLPATRAN